MRYDGIFPDKGAGNIVIMSGGASVGNRLHQVRTWGMLNTLEEKAGLVLPNRQKNFQKQIRPQNSQIKMEWYMLRSVRDIQKDGTVLRIFKAVLSSETATLFMSAFHVSTYLG